jgi:hypothetical protein
VRPRHVPASLSAGKPSPGPRSASAARCTGSTVPRRVGRGQRRQAGTAAVVMRPKESACKSPESSPWPAPAPTGQPARSVKLLGSSPWRCLPAGQHLPHDAKLSGTSPLASPNTSLGQEFPPSSTPAAHCRAGWSSATAGRSCARLGQSTPPARRHLSVT